MRNLLEGVQLDSYQCFLPWGCPRPRVEALLRERAVPVEVQRGGAAPAAFADAGRAPAL